MATTLTSLSVSKIPANGGQYLVLTGVFEVGIAHEVYIGLNGGITDDKCHSGKTDQQNLIYPWSATELRCYTPILDADETMSVTVQNMTTTDTDTLADSLEITYQQFQSTVFGLRKVLPLFYKAGARDVEEVPTIT